ncbi:hypothetical protein KXS11_07280 [Plantibacter flavus]|uniref:hypothetical protein n=1 Tax=Plantibacter flavus TaxID=150123 RepID=UPI003F139359
MNARSFRRLFGFLILPMLGAISPLIALPAITSNFGARAWAAIAIAQSVGAACGVIVELGWGLNGPQRVARAQRRNQRQIMATSIATKASAFVVMGPLAVVLSAALAPGYVLAVALVALGATGVGLTASWFFVGTGSPAKIMVTDSLPRIAAVIIATLLISVGAPLYVYGLAILIPSLISPLLAIVLTGVSPVDFRAVRGVRLLIAIRLQLVALSGRAVSALYIALPITLVSLVSPQSVAVFASIERLQRMTLTVLQSVPNFMQGWVGRTADREMRLKRATHSILLNAVMGAAAGGVFTALAPWVSSVLFSGVVTISFTLSALGGCMIFIVCVSRATGNIALVALRNIRAISLSALAGALIGVPAILVLAFALGPAGGLLGEIIAEAVVLSIQLTAVRRAIKRG